jgi:peroxiredoxin
MRTASLLFLLSAVSPLVAAAPPETIGTPIADFTLPDCHGQVFHLSDQGDRAAIVVVFLGVDCPLAKLYGPRLAEMARTFGPRGVAFVGIDSNQHDSLAALARYGKQHRIPFPLLRDPGNAIADRFGAERTPEAFVLDRRRVIRYRGRIDDQYDVATHRGEANRHDLAQAIEEVLAGKPVSQPVTTAPGCLISRAPAPRTDDSITYSRHVAPILQRHCQVCHRPGEIGPFSLTNYRHAAGWAAMIREVVEEGRMPPWHADPKHGRFANDPTLTAEEKDLLFRWIDTGCPEGDRRDLPLPAKFIDGWNIGTPDVVLEMPEPFGVPAEGIVEYQYVVVDGGAAVDRWVQAAEVRPGNRAVVHHCNVFLQPPGAPDFMEAGALGSFCLAAMAPGTPPLLLPDGLAKRIPAGWRIVLVLHYTTTGSPQTDRTRLGLKLVDPKRVTKEVATKLMYDLDLEIPPGVADHTVSQTWQINNAVDLLAFFPHMHLRGKSFRYEALYPDGNEEILLEVPRYDFNWQHRYVLAEPKRLPAGSRLRCTAVYDNSAGNPANPDPTATVRAGTQSFDEMFNGYFDVVLADQDLTRGQSWREALAGLRAFVWTGLVLSFLLAGALGLLWAGRRGTPGGETTGEVSSATP